MSLLTAKWILIWTNEMSEFYKTLLISAKEAQIKIEERPFTIEEAKKAAEAFVSSATTFIGPVVEIDNQKIGDGRPGKQSLRLREIYINESMKNALHAW